MLTQDFDQTFFGTIFCNLDLLESIISSSSSCNKLRVTSWKLATNLVATLVDTTQNSS